MNRNQEKKTALLIIMISCESKPGEKNSSQVPKFFDRLVGTWKMDNGPLYEEWQKSENTYSGKTFQNNGRQPVTKETFIIHETKEATYFRVTVFNQNEGKPIDFLLTYSDNNEVWFEKQDHDFPRTIKYSLLDDNHLKTTLSGLINEETQTMEFTYSRKN